MAVHFSEEQHLLRIGDTVLLYAKEALGYVFSELTSGRHSSVALYKVDSMRDPNLPNIHSATFTVVSANKYKAQEQFSQYQSSLRGREPSTEEKSKLQHYERALKSECRENATEQERLKGSNIVYGDKVQLLHNLTKQYLTVNTTKISRTENTNLRVQLTPNNAQGCIFKILPRYKVHSVGDEVRYNDQIKFESAKTEGQFLHCSACDFGTRFRVLGSSRELNLSATESAFTLIAQYRPITDYPSNAFRGGQVVRLFHREYECYLSAEGSFAEQPPLVEDVHCRRRHSERGRLKDPSTSANVYWQFEKESDPRSGESLYWGERCRIKHLPTRLYLAVVSCVGGGYSTTLKERVFPPNSGQEGDLDTVFSLSPVIREGDTILTESYARIKHLQTSTWLHLEKGVPYTRQAFKPDAPGLEGLEWDSAQLFMLSATETMNYDDAFTLEGVEEALVDKFNHVAGIVPILTAHIAKYDVTPQPSADVRSAYLVESALTNLADYLTNPCPRETKNRQKLLRNLRVLELVIKILGFFSPKAPDAEIQRSVCKGCYNVIKNYLNGDSRKNENYLARFIPFFKQQVNMDLNAEEVMIEMVEDNSAIVSRVVASELDYMIDQLISEKDPRFMDFLGNLCVCAGRPIPATQKAILKKLVVAHGEEVFYRLMQQGDNLMVRGPGLTSRALVLVAHKDGEPSKECKFLASQLNLFARLCKGNNANVIYTLGENELAWMNFDLVLSCAHHDDLQPSLRSRFVQLMTVMYVDIGNNRNVLENLSLSFVYESVVEEPYKDTGKEHTVAFTGEKNVNFPKMRDWVLEHLKCVADRGLIAEEEAENTLVADILIVLKQLVQYGFYDDANDINCVLIPLVKILDGHHDKPFPTRPGKRTSVVEEAERAFTKSGRYQPTKENKPIFEIKKRGIEVVDLFLNFRFFIRLQRFIYDFQVLKGSQKEFRDHQFESSSLTHILPRSDPPSLGLEGLLQLTANEVLQEENDMLAELTRERLKYLFSLTEYYIEEGCTRDLKRSFSDLLLDLSRYHDDDLIQESLHLLNRLFSAESSLFQQAIQAELLVVPESIRVFNEIGLKLPALRRNMSIDAGARERAAIIQTLRRFTKICTLSNEDCLAHGQNQRILYNYGILSDVLNYVTQASETVLMMENTDSQYGTQWTRRTLRGALGTQGGTDIPNVVVECFHFLKALSRDNLTVKQRLYNRMNDLLEVGIAMPAIGELLTEVFTGGTEICLKVTEAQVEHLFALLAHEGVEGRPELILTLQAMAKVESLDLPVKRNQAFIIKHFSKTRHHFCDHILGEGEHMVAERSKLLHQVQDSDQNLALLLAMTDLLASCSEGKNLLIESVCQKVFAVEELLAILTSSKLAIERKRPFARFLVSVYMSTGGDKHSSGAAQLTNSEAFWSFLDMVGNVLDNIGLALKGLPVSETSTIRHNVNFRSRRFSYHMRPLPPISNGGLTNMTRQDGRLLPGVLLYLTEGLLPLLYYFYDEFFEPHGKQRQLDISGKLLMTLLQLCESLRLHLLTDEHVKLYRRTVLTILARGHGQIPICPSIATLTKFDIYTQSCQALEPPVLISYKNEYAVELELNKLFNNFVSRYQLAYQGRNDAKVQLGSKYKKKYSDYLDNDQSQPGNEWLPLGPSFQDHVKLFLKDNCEVSEVVEQLLRQLEISFKNFESLTEKQRERQDKLDIKCLQIMRAIIHNEIVRINPQLLEDSPPDYRNRCVEKVHPLQNAIQDFDNAVSRVIPMLSHPNDAIVCEVLAFLKAIFFSGNRHVQQGMKHLLDTREERLFTTVQALLKNSATSFNESRGLIAEMNSRITDDIFLQTDATTLLQPPCIHNSAQQRRNKLSTNASISIDMDEGLEEDSLPCGLPVLLLIKNPAPEPEPVINSHGAHSKGEMLEMKVSSLVSQTIGGACGVALSTLTASTLQTQGVRMTDSMTLEMLAFRDTRHVKLALQVLGLMCDGQYRLMQNYLREQRDNLTTINVIGEVAMFLQHFYTDINADTMDLVHLILQTLIEMCVGNYPNQVVLHNRHIVEALNHILAIHIAEGERSKDKLIESIKLKGSAIELLEAMLEETNIKTKELVMEIQGSLDIAALHITMTHFKALMSNPVVQQEQFDDDARAGLFRTYHALVHLQHYGVDSALIEPKTDEGPLHEAWMFCKKHSKSVEVFYRNMNDEKILTKVYFPFDPDHELREEVIDKVKWNVNRDSPEDKLRDFLKWINAVKKDTLHQKRLHRFKAIRILTSFPERRHYLLILWSLLMNILVLMSFGLPQDKLDRTPYDLRAPNDTVYTLLNTAGAMHPQTLSYMVVNGVDVFRVLLYLCGSIHLVMTLWFVIEYFVVNWPNFKLPLFVYTLMKRWHKVPEKSYSDIPIFGLMTVYVVLFLLASVLSLVFYGYFYCLCLLHVIINNDILQRVLRSITKNGMALIWVAVLGVIVLLIYGVISFAFLSEAFRAENNSDGDLFCNTLYECVVSTLRYGLIDNLGLIVPLVPTKFEVSALRLLYDLSFFIIVTTIGLNIVFGIIVDTFSELRDERFRTEQDKKAMCFICGLPSHEFERRAKGFKNHVEKDHNMWDYIYYSLYLDGINTSDHNAVQSYVWHKIQESQLDFFPLLNALTLESKEDETSLQLEKLSGMVQSVLQRFKNKDHEKSRRSKLLDQQQWEQVHLRKGCINHQASFDISGRSSSASFDPSGRDLLAIPFSSDGSLGDEEPH